MPAMKENTNKRNLSFEEGWPVLQEEAINKLIHLIQQNDFNTSFFTSDEYMRIYTIVYDMCKSDFRGPEAEKLYEHYEKTFHDYISSKVLPSLRGKKDEILLKELIKQWKIHKIMTRWLSRFFHYLDRYYLPILKLPSLQQTSHLVFYNLVYGEMNDQIRDALVSMINKERNGEQIDQTVMKNVVDIYVAMAGDSTKYYEKDFENAMLLEATRFYTEKASNWISSNSYEMYMLKVEECLRQEKIRVETYLRSSSNNKLLEVVQENLVTAQENKLEEMKQNIVHTSA